MKRIAIIGGGVAGVTAAYEFARQARAGSPLHATLFEATKRLGGTVETIREGGFIIEAGPDAWVTEKPWARDLAIELGLEDELQPSNDATRRTFILKDNQLQPIPDGMRMMVPTDLSALDRSSLFSDAAKQAYRQEPARAAELKATAPVTDESVASFVRRHFGPEVLDTIAAPLLSGVFGGDVATLSVRAVMAPFVAMEREYGSLIIALQTRAAASRTSAIFTTLRSGTATLIDRMVATLPASWLRMNSKVVTITPEAAGWTVTSSSSASTAEHFDEIFLAAPIDTARNLLAPIDPRAATLMTLDSSSAVIVAFALPDAAQFPLPPGFGFLVPPPPSAKSSPPSSPARLTGDSAAMPAEPASHLLACTFTDQKFDGRVPPGARLVRAFFGGPVAERLMDCGNDEIAAIARLELARILGPLPPTQPSPQLTALPSPQPAAPLSAHPAPHPAPQLVVVRRWPRSLPQYAVGHLDRIAELDARIADLPGLTLLGNGYRGVGLPDLIRDARAAARTSAMKAVP